MNYSQGKPSPKLLMQFSRNEEVPKLVSIHDVGHKENRNRLLQQARFQSSHAQPRRGQEGEVALMRQSLEGERGENEELRSAVKELTRELQKLREVNEGLIRRIQEVEGSYRMLKGEYERSCEEEMRRLRNGLYADVEEYIRAAVERLTLTLKSEKMTPLLEDKLERFMAELLQINAVSVEQFSRRKEQYKRRESRVQASSRGKESRQMEKYLTEASEVTRRAPSRDQYASIMQRLTGEARMSKSFAVGPGASSQDARLRTVYATTPQKRRKIFD